MLEEGAFSFSSENNCAQMKLSGEKVVKYIYGIAKGFRTKVCPSWRVNNKNNDNSLLFRKNIQICT